MYEIFIQACEGHITVTHSRYELSEETIDALFKLTSIYTGALVLDAEKAGDKIKITRMVGIVAGIAIQLPLKSWAYSKYYEQISKQLIL